ncbi:hypothetical protein P8H27_02005 [Pseudomonas sp. sp1636]|uniref:hypothetical protein n=1 Tax=Pseudomonas sp. sp1636 TaxID=3036707 RepID=UPI0025A5D636|nr:hypothetical protein [Pseudomonas sp. sp1636]MDM8347673.1 hypothetical protein [Pseudomonas sp. sp1636]
MKEKQSRTKSQGRPSLSPVEKQRRLVARLFESCADLELRITEESGHDAATETEAPLLLSTFNQRLSFARDVAIHEHAGRSAEAKSIRQKLNLFRPQGFTEEAWNTLPDAEKRMAPGKPKMPKELELARIEIKREDELEKLKAMEAEFGDKSSDIDSLRALHGKNQIGRPGKDILGTLDRQMHTAFYKRRDLARYTDQDEDQDQSMGRPKKSYEERYAYFTSIIDHCRDQIHQGESKLDLIHLQLRYLKRLRDRATRLRLQVKTALGPALVSLKKDLAVVEAQIEVEASQLSDFQNIYITMSNSQIETRRNSVVKKIKSFDSIEFTNTNT